MIISLNIAKRFVFVNDMLCVFCEVVTELLNIIQTIVVVEMLGITPCNVRKVR